MHSDSTPISDEIDMRIRRQVESGRFAHANDVIECALELLEDEEVYGFSASDITSIRDVNVKRMSELNQGNGLSGDVVFDELERRFAGQSQHQEQ